MILVPSNLKCRIIPKLTVTEDNAYQSLSILVNIGNIKYTISGIYRLPSTALTHNFHNLLKSISAYSNNTIIAGDFNLPKCVWGDIQPGYKLTPFQISMDNLALTQIVDFPTRLTNFLDLIFVSNKTLLNSVSQSDAFGESVGKPSDHSAITMCSTIPILFEPTEYEFPNYSAANWDLIKYNLWNTNWDAFFEPCQSSVSMMVKLSDYIDTIIHLYVPIFRSTPKSFSPIHDPTLTRLRNVERRLTKKLRKHIANAEGLSILPDVNFDIYDLYCQRNNLRRDIRRRYKPNRLNAETLVLKSKNPKKFWNHVNSMKKLINSIPILIDADGNDVVSDIDKAELFSKQFAYSPPDPIPLAPNKSNPTKPPIHFIPNLRPFPIEHVLKNLKNNKAMGIDNIPNCFLRKVHNELAVPLSKIFTVSYYSGKFPSIHKIAIVYPAHKKKGRSDPVNYRPLSLNPTISKVFEKTIATQLIEKCSNLNLLSPNQFGFLPGRSVESQLLKCTNDWTLNLENKTRTDILYLDLTKAFDRVSHKLLLNKLKNYGFPPDFMTFITSYLSERTQIVSINNVYSQPRKVPMGVPQGSVLGPLLFVLFINDISDVVKHSNIVIYADDIKIYKTIKSIADWAKLQTDINSVCDWLQNNGLTLSTEKCGILKIGENFLPTVNQPYHIAGQDITEFDSFRDLGVQIDNQLTFDSHVRSLATRASNISKCLKNAFDTPAKSFRLQMHKTFVLPILESFSPIWSPQAIGQIKQIESVQRSFTNRLFDSPEPTYTDRCKELEIKTLISRRYFTDLITIHKLLHGKYVNLDYRNFFTLNTSTTRSGSHSLRIVKVGRRSSARRNFLVDRITDLWNKFSFEVVQNHTTSHFKSLLNGQYHIINTYVDQKFPTVFT